MFMPSAVVAATGGAPVALLGGNFNNDETSPTDAEVSYRLTAAGLEQRRIGTGGGYTTLGSWLITGVAADYQAQFTSAGPDPTAPDPVNVWKDCDLGNQFDVTETGVGATSAAGTIRIRRKSDSVPLASAALTITAEVSL